MTSATADAAEMSFESPPTGTFEDVNMDDLGMDEAYLRVHNDDADVAFLYGRSEDCDKCSFESYGAVRAFILRNTVCNEAMQVLGGDDGLSRWIVPLIPERLSMKATVADYTTQPGLCCGPCSKFPATPVQIVQNALLAALKD